MTGEKNLIASLEHLDTLATSNVIAAVLRSLESVLPLSDVAGTSLRSGASSMS
jgi:hypothetical protein